MNPLVAAVRHLAYRVWSFHIRGSVDRSDTCRLLGLDLVIEPGVLHPRHFASSRTLARYVMGLDLAGRSVADVGTGSGVLGLLAARAGATVTAMDLNPAAVACASENVRRNGLQNLVSVVHSDVFSGLPDDQRFDFVITNPPFYPRNPVSASDNAFAAGAQNDFFTKLADGLRTRLTRGGVLVLIQSSDADFAPISRAIEATGLRGRVMGRKRGLFETLTIREFTLPESLPRGRPPIEA